MVLLKQEFCHVQSDLLMWSPLLRGHLPLAATFSRSLELKYCANERVLRDPEEVAANGHLP